jgi:hypothetical protein
MVTVDEKLLSKRNDKRNLEASGTLLYNVNVKPRTCMLKDGVSRNKRILV